MRSSSYKTCYKSLGFGKSPGPLALGDEDLALFSHQWFRPRYIPPMGGKIERSLGNKTSTSSKPSSLSSSIQRIQSCFFSDLILFFQIFDVGMIFSSFSRFSPGKASRCHHIHHANMSRAIIRPQNRSAFFRPCCSLCPIAIKRRKHNVRTSRYRKVWLHS